MGLKNLGPRTSRDRAGSRVGSRVAPIDGNAPVEARRGACNRPESGSMRDDQHATTKPRPGGSNSEDLSERPEIQALIRREEARRPIERKRERALDELRTTRRDRRPFLPVAQAVIMCPTRLRPDLGLANRRRARTNTSAPAACRAATSWRSSTPRAWRASGSSGARTRRCSTGSAPSS
jgi:hypothetical protein